MKRLLTALVGTAVLALAVGPAATTSGGSLWTASVPFTNVVASTPTSGGGYPVPPGSRVPLAGTCRPGPFNANHSESWLAVKPGTEDLVGSSKFFFDKYSTFYMFYLGAYQILGGTPSGNNQVQGYDCVPARWAVVSSATTSRSRSPRATSTRSWSRRTIPRTSSPTRVAASTTSSRSWPRCRAALSAPATDIQKGRAGACPALHDLGSVGDQDDAFEAVRYARIELLPAARSSTRPSEPQPISDESASVNLAAIAPSRAA
jgi:hypothetical protein